MQRGLLFGVRLHYFKEKNNQKCFYSVNTLLIESHTASLSITGSPSPSIDQDKRVLEHINYDVIISFTEVAVATFGPFRLSLMSLRKTERFWVKRSLFFVNKVLSIPSIRFSNLQNCFKRISRWIKTKSDHVIMAALLSAC